MIAALISAQVTKQVVIIRAAMIARSAASRAIEIDSASTEKYDEEIRRAISLLRSAGFCYAVAMGDFLENAINCRFFMRSLIENRDFCLSQIS